MGGGFTAEAANLEDAANKALRPLAAELRFARENLSATAEFDGGFSAGNSGSIFDPAGNRWQEARGFLERIFDDNAETLDLAAEALVEIARRYRDVDAGTAQGMQSIENQGLR